MQSEALESRHLLSGGAKPTFNAIAIGPTQIEVFWLRVKGGTGTIVQEGITSYKSEKIHGHRVTVLTLGWETLAQVGKVVTRRSS